MNRRTAMAVVATAGLSISAGCLDELEQLMGDESDPSSNRLLEPGPDPELLDQEASADLGILTGEYTVYALVRNHGGTGDIRITVEFTGSNRNTIIDRYSEIRNLREGEQRRFSIEVSPPRDTERYRVEVEAA